MNIIVRSPALFSVSFVVFLQLCSFVRADAPAPLTWEQIGLEASRQVPAGSLDFTRTDDGHAAFRCAMQNLAGEITPDGLRLTSSCGGALSVRADSLSRAAAASHRSVAARGSVEIGGGSVRWVRDGLVEEFFVSAGGVRQDFIVADRTHGEGDLRVGLAIEGATVSGGDSALQLVLDGSGRALSYSKLRVTDAGGQALPAHFEIRPGGADIVVADAGAAYPIRIDPTFSDADWYPFGLQGVNAGGGIRAVLANSTNIFVGGYFTNIAGVAAQGLARWTGNAWTSMINNLISREDRGYGSWPNVFDYYTGTVFALELSANGTLYVGGNFFSINGSTMQGIAQWNGSSWSAVGGGLDDTDDGSQVGVEHTVLSVISPSNGTLFIGGTFAQVGSPAVGRVAYWNGSTWTGLASGVNSDVYAMKRDGSGNLYVGGEFTTAGGLNAQHVAKWNGSAWSALGAGIGTSTYPNTVRSLELDGSGNLYAGGRFTNSGSTAVRNIAKWNGSSWSALGSGIDGSDAYVHSLAWDSLRSRLYAAGTFDSAGGIPSANVAQWNGAAWLPMGPGMNSSVFAMDLDASGTLLAGGIFTEAGDAPARGIARFDKEWLPIASSASPGTNVYCMLADTNRNLLFVGGGFTNIGTIAANAVAVWDGSQWSALSSGVVGSVSAMAFDSDTNLYVVGTIYDAGGFAANHIAKWDGTFWQTVGSGLPGYLPSAGVSALAIDKHDKVYATQWFVDGANQTYSVPRVWDGVSWNDVGTAPRFHGTVSSMATDGTNVYFGGSFYQFDEYYGVYTNMNSIAKWNGSSWSGLGGGAGGTVYAMQWGDDGNLYAGGYGTSFTGSTGHVVGKWDGSTWTVLGGSLPPEGPQDMALDSAGNLYVGGYITNAGGTAVGNIAAWDGSTWNAIGSGANYFVYSMAIDPWGRVCAGGKFDTLDGNAINGIGYVILRKPKIQVVGTNSAFVASDEEVSVPKGTDYDDVLPAGTQVDHTFRLLNLGSADLHISGVTTSGTGAAAFKVIAWPGTVDYNNMSNLVVRYTPPATPGIYEANIVFANDAGTFNLHVRGSSGCKYIDATRNTDLGDLDPRGHWPVYTGSNQTFTMFSSNNLLPVATVNGANMGILYSHTFTNVVANTNTIDINFQTDTIVSGVIVTQRSLVSKDKYIDMHYDLADLDDSSNAITVEISTDGGTTYDLIPTTVSGDVGEGIAEGTGKSIVWLAHKDWDGNYSDTVVVRITATDDNGDAWSTSAVITLDTEYGVRPRITDIRGLNGIYSQISREQDYFNSDQEAFFLDDIGLLYGASEFEIDCKATIDWKGTTPGTVKWYVNGNFSSSEAPSAEPSFSMSDGFGVGGKLEAVAVGNEGATNEGRSAKIPANFKIIEPPKLWTRYTATAPLLGNSKSYSFLSPHVNYSKKSDEEVPSKTGSGKDVPGAKGKNQYSAPLEFEVSGDVDMQEPGGSLGAKVSKEFEVKAFTVKPSVSGGVDYEYDDDEATWDYGGYLGLSVDVARESQPVYLCNVPPLYGKLGAHLEVGGTIHFDSNFNPKWGETEFGFTPGIWATLGCGLPGFANVEGKIQLDIPNTFTVQPFTYDLSLDLSAEISAQFLMWSTTIWSEHWQYEIYKYPASRPAYIEGKVNEDMAMLPPGQFQLMSRDYLHEKGEGRALFNVIASRDGTVLGEGLAARAPEPQTGEIFVQGDTFPYSEPALDVRGTNRMLLWVGDAGTNRITQNANTLFWETWGATNWINRGILADDGTGDSAPQLGLLANGAALAAWQNGGYVLSSTSGLSEGMAALEIAAARYDGTNWTAVNLTTNNVMDRTPQLAVASNGTAMLAWLRNGSALDTNTIFTTDPDSICLATWNGSAWSQASVLITNVGKVLSHDLAYNGTLGYLIFAMDTDYDLATTADQELFRMSYSNGTWSSVGQLTQDGIQDSRPQVYYYSGNYPLIFWLRDGGIRWKCCDDNAIVAGSSVIADIGGTSAAQDFRLIHGDGLNMAVIWEDGREPPYFQNPYLLVYDNHSFPTRWSKPVQLVGDSALERSFTGTYTTNDTVVLAYNKVEVQLDPGNVATQLGPVVALSTFERQFGYDVAVFSSELTVSTNNPQPGSTVDVSVVVRNLGELSSFDTRVVFYDGNPLSGGTIIGDTNLVNFDTFNYSYGYVDAGDTATVTTAWTVPAGTSSHTLYAVVTTTAADRDLANNTASTTVMSPDLRIRTASDDKVSKSVRTLKVTTINDGVIPAGTNHIQIRRDATNGPVLHQGTIATLAAGARATNTYDWDMSGETFTSDFVYVFAVVDASNQVAEAREDNNMRGFRIITPRDTDNDGLLDGEEGRYSCSATNSDTDGDGLSDYDEVNIYGSDPSDRDTDHDGLNDSQEASRSTENANPDSDGDGYSDGVEVAKGTDPLNTASHPGFMANLVINGNPANYGISRPYGFGTNKYDDGQSVTCSVSDYVTIKSGVRVACTGWTGSGSVPATGSGTQALFTITANSVITWQWQKQYQVDVIVLPDGTTTNGGGIVSATASLWCAQGGSVTVTAVPDVGFTFAGWSGGCPPAQTNQNPLVLSPTNRTTVLAQFQRRKVTFQVSSPYGAPDPAQGTATNDYGDYVGASVASPEVHGSTSYICTGWTLSGHDPASGSGTVATVFQTNNAVLSWLWVTNVLLTANADAFGEVTGDPNGWYPYGSVVTVTAAPNPTYVFSKWTGNVPGQTNQNPLVVTMTQARAVVAHFLRQTATVSVVASPTNGGGVGGSGTFITGTDISISATAKVNWAFTSWNDGNTNPTRTITVPTTNITYTAGFSQIVVTVSVVINPAAAGSATGMGLYYAGSNATLTITPAPNWIFTNWNDGVTTLTRNVSVPTTNITYTANFWRASPSYWYVATNGNDTNAGTAWTNAKRTIQAAIDVAYTNDIITVSNGVYATGGRPFGGYGLTNRVVIDKPVVVRSLNGPGTTVIRGAGPAGPAAVRGVYVGAGATLSGFTVTNGATLLSGNEANEQSGGGVRAADSGVISNCVMAGNTATIGGGASGGTYFNCSLLGNSAGYAGGVENATLTGCNISGNSATDQGGGAAGCMLTACTVAGNMSLSSGGGAIQCTMSRCVVSGNQAANRGGGAYLGTLDNCLLFGNTADRGAGAYYAVLNNCTVSSNEATTAAGGASGGTVRNSILYFNAAPASPNHDDAIDLANSCSTPLAAGSGNTDVDPQFISLAATNVRLQAWSACIDAGVFLAASGALDLDANPRLTNAAMDMGAFEYQGVPSSNDADDDGIPNAWEAAYGLNPGGSNAPDADADADGRTDWQEYISDTHPTNGSSFFPNVALTNPPPGTMSLVLDPTSTGRIYEVQYSTNLPSDTQAWYLYGSGLFGTGAELVFTVTNDAPMRTYRTSVRLP